MNIPAILAEQDGYEDVRGMLWFFAIIAVIAIFAFIGSLLGKKKNNSGGVAVLGAALGPIGWAGTILLSDKRRQCPACKGRVPDDARKCMHCGETLPAPPAEY